MCILNLNYPDFGYSYPIEPTEEDYDEYLKEGGKPISFTSEGLEQSYDFYTFMVHKYERKAYLMYTKEQDMLVTSLTEAEISKDSR